MTHLSQSNVCQSAVQVLAEAGFDGLAKALELLFNEAMKIERTEFLGAAPYERSERRRGQANGFKDKTVQTRVGNLELKVPQARESDFYPQTLQRGVRSERALTAALAEMYVCGVSTRKVSRIVEELCGHQVSSSTVSRLAGQLDTELQRWRTRPLGETPYLVFDARYEHVRQQGAVVTVAVLTAIGVTPEGNPLNKSSSNRTSALSTFLKSRNNQQLTCEERYLGGRFWNRLHSILNVVEFQRF
jgi:putative transposase